MAKLEDIGKQQHCSILQFPKPQRDTTETRVKLLLPERAGCYVMKVIDPGTGEVLKKYEVFEDPDNHLGSVYD